MASPATHGVIVYAKSVGKLAEFYINMFGMDAVRETAEFISLDKDGMNIIIHRSPIEMPSENFSRVKIFITVGDLSEARKKALALGGQVLEGEWANPIFKLCNIADSEGNHIQIREFV